MLFNSIDFLIFFPVTVFIYYMIPHKMRYIWLLISSYYFYMCWNVTYVLLILISTAITYIGGRLIDHIGKFSWGPEVCAKKVTMFVCIMANLGILGYFKYYNFFIDNINAILSVVGIRFVLPSVDVLLPVGISFYTFQALGYIIDVYRGEIKAERNFLKYALFVSFFPQLVAGPIERSGRLLKQINNKHYWDYERAWEGALLMLWGYFLKVVLADRITILVDTVYGDINMYGDYVLVASVLFAIQIYGDFAGYSTIALGAAKIMGFELTDNFNAPYFSTSISEFWRRWHVSLSGWFRDYIYIPLGGNQKGKVRKYINLMLVFLISGLWHGATWSFILWGILHGLYQILGDVLKPIRDRAVKLMRLNRDCISHKFYRIVVTFVLVDIAWIFFRAGNLKNSIQCFTSILHAKNPWILFDDSLFLLGLDWKNFMIMLFSIIVLATSDFCKYRGVVLRKVIIRQEWWFRGLSVILSVIFILTFGIWGSGYNEAGFIYFQF